MTRGAIWGWFARTRMVYNLPVNNGARRAYFARSTAVAILCTPLEMLAGASYVSMQFVIWPRCIGRGRQSGVCHIFEITGAAAHAEGLKVFLTLDRQ